MDKGLTVPKWVLTAKGQLISECLLDVIILTNKATIVLKISALAFKNIYYTNYVK